VSSPWQVLNARALREAPLVAEPFPYLIVDNLIRPEVLAEVVESFPRIDKRGSFPPEAVSCSGRFATLMAEMHSAELRDLIGERLGMDLKDRPPMLTVRGRTGKKDGRIHADSKSKLVTVLLYLNPGWSAAEGRLRLLYNDHDLTRYAAEISPDAELLARTRAFRGRAAHHPAQLRRFRRSSRARPEAAPLQRIPERAAFEER